ncbi:MAG TPA: T9SS type A sorting domain-containing protein [Ignavibacteria bacterium]|nr:T9SS type A sorting domain-containing protein [Ignavibacteria bacterium]HMR41886.1 T9SS type A sorting domain-containing protein [Ignavibacteria bacterium]
MKFNFYNSEKGSGIINYVIILFSVFLLNSVSMATTHVVTVSSFQFTPNTLSVTVGDTVKWQWVDGSHTTTSVTIPNGATPWNSPMTSSNQTFSYAVTVAGTYNYQCTPHSSIMMGNFTASAGGGNTLLTENFDYPAGDSLGAHGWVSFSGGSTNYLAVTSPGLTYTGYPLSNIGNATTVLTSGQDAYKDMSSVDSTGAIYVSFMVNVTSAQAGNYFFALLPPNSTSFYSARFYAQDDGGLKFGLSKAAESTGPIVYTTDTYSFGTTYLVVIKYQYNPGTDDAECFAYIFSSGVPSTEPSTATIGPVTGTSPDNNISRIALRQGTASSSPVTQVDGFNAGKSWSDILTSVRNVSSNIADGYNLSQNYPNPFNPSTTIKFDIADAGFVNLTVYNSLGKEVSRLVNQNLNRGSYSSEFTGANLTSGVYYYRLTFTGSNNQNFTDTKKLILLK